MDPSFEFIPLGSNLFTAIGAIMELRLNAFVAVGTFSYGSPGVGTYVSGFLSQRSTTPAFKNRGALFNPDDGQKKNRKVMIHSFEMCLKKTTGSAHHRRVVKVNGFGLYSGYEKKHGICVIEKILLFLSSA